MRTEYCPDCGERLSFDAYHNSLYCTGCEYVLVLTQPSVYATLTGGRVGREFSRSRASAVIKG